MRAVALVLNPAARGAERARQAVLGACRAAGLDEPLVLETTPQETGAEQARQAVASGVRRVVVAGGDGTVREVAGAVRSAGVLGVVPCGTANLAARSLGIPLGPPGAAARAAVTGEGREVDLGLATVTATDGGQRVLPFLVVVGVGHDARAIAAMSPAAKARLGWPAYLTPGLRRLSASGTPLSVRLDDEDAQQVRAWSVLAVNAARLPLGAQLAPGARPDDGMLHVVIVRPRRISDWGRIAAGGYRVRRPDPVLERRAGQRLRIELPEPGAVQVDGDVVSDVVAARITVVPALLRIAR